jgi:F-type H+-transporting ATPase subunit b
MLFEAEFWVAVAFVIFMGILAYAGVPRMLGRSLDERGARIKTELDEARRLREEAQAVLAEYHKRRQDAEREAQAILDNAKAEGERMAADAATKVEEFVARRTKMAEIKIGQAEAQAVADVRAAAAEAAVSAAAKVLAETVKGEVADGLIATGIKELKAKLK